MFGRWAIHNWDVESAYGSKTDRPKFCEGPFYTSFNRSLNKRGPWKIDLNHKDIQTCNISVCDTFRTFCCSFDWGYRLLQRSHNFINVFVNDIQSMHGLKVVSNSVGDWFERNNIQIAPWVRHQTTQQLATWSYQQDFSLFSIIFTSRNTSSGHSFDHIVA